MLRTLFAACVPLLGQFGWDLYDPAARMDLSDFTLKLSAHARLLWRLIGRSGDAEYDRDHHPLHYIGFHVVNLRLTVSLIAKPRRELSSAV
jgi:hypothetical protein